MKKAIVLTSLVLGLSSVAFAHGNDDKSDKQQSSVKSGHDQHGALSDQEASIVRQLHKANQTEVAAGKLAKSNAGSQAVKQYGQMLVSDHSAADRKLAAFAGRRDLELKEPEVDLGQLEDKQGDAFDEAFLDKMVKDHAENIAKVKQAMQTCDDSGVRSILQQTLPVLQKHQTQAAKLQQKRASKAATAD